MRATVSTLKLEGGLIGHDIIERIAAGEECGQKPSDFGFDSRRRLSDEIAAAWSDARDLWHVFERRLERLPEDDLATTATRDQWVIPLLSSLGYELIYQPRAAEIDGLTFSISHKAGKDDAAPPVHIVGARQSLDRKPESGRPRLAPHALLQEYINRTDQVWGLVTNGKILRILRDSQRMRKQAYIEFDLQQMMAGEKFADLALLYRLLHRTRLPQTFADAHECFLEKYYLLTIEQGGRVRDRLRDGVEEALKIFANGFINNLQNGDLREEISSGKLTSQNFYRQLLRLIYRFLFLMVAEERNLITDNPIYSEHYSISRLRRLLEIRSSWTAHDDLWLELRTTFELFRDEKLGQYLNVPPLNGDLFNGTEMTSLDNVSLTNRDLLNALWHLGMYREDERSPWHRINYAALDVEELGSVYESLLEFHPIFIEKDVELSFDLVPGTERKSTGSYYTPPELVQELIKSALVPVIEDRVKKAPSKEEALLSIRVLDPACGSGHFLLAAARRLGKDLAKTRTGEDEPTPESLRLAIRDVITHCIYGVDKNPLAVDLCKVALWIEGHAKDKPLTFLDHRIRCGDSLVGVMDLNVLNDGIPDEAFAAVEGDDKSVARSIKKRNKEEREGQRSLPFETAKELKDLRDYLGALSQIPDDKPDNIRKKSEAYQNLHSLGTKWWRDQTACNIWTAAFFIELTPENERENRIPTYEILMSYIDSGAADARTTGYSWLLAQRHAFFHWPLEFPEVFVQGGFDVVLGNPPWEILELEEQEFFASLDAEIAKAPNKAARSTLIRKLPETNLALWREYKEALHTADALNKYLRQCDRFPLTARGRTNTYSVFAELASGLINVNARVGIVVPTGIATDDTNKFFFAHLVEKEKLASLYDFENREALFPGVHRSYKFSLLTISNKPVQKSDFAFFLLRSEHLSDDRRRFTLSAVDFSRLNPNTRTCPVFRTKIDTEITKKIYERVPVLINEQTGENPWGATFKQGLFNMSSDSHLFRNKQQLESEGFRLWGNRFAKGDEVWLPLYEAKMIWQFDHRFGTYEGVTSRSSTHLPTPTPEQYADSNFIVMPWYWVQENEVNSRLESRDRSGNLSWRWSRGWLLGFRNVTNTTNERTAIFSLISKLAIGHSAPLLFVNKIPTTPHCTCLLANFSSIVFDYCVRQKLGGINMTFNYIQQFPILPPDLYNTKDLLFMVPYVFELIFTSWDLKPFADDVWKDADEELKVAIRKQWEENRLQTGGHSWNPPEWAEISQNGIPLSPFKWDENRRAILRAELDAYYAKLYGLTRDELCYILDPKDIYGPDFPGETFRVLKEKEEREFGKYRTRLLVLEVWDNMEKISNLTKII
jgi:hypothetical protein